MRMLAVIAMICLTLFSCGLSQQELENKRAEAQAQREAQRLNLANAIKSSQAFSGVFVDNRSEKSYPFNIRFTHFDETTGAIIGEMQWLQSGVIKQIEGLFLNQTLTFKASKILSAGDRTDSVLGTSYTFSPAENNQIKGSWRKVFELPLSELLGDRGVTEESSGNVSFDIGYPQGQK